MNKEIEGVEALLEQLDSKDLFGGLEWDIVDNKERRTSALKYLDDAVTRQLSEDKTVRIKGHTRADRYRRWADANELKLTVRHPLPNLTLIWIAKKGDKDAEDKSATSGADQEPSTVSAG